MDIANHGLFLLQQLNSQREFGFLCDCTVAIGDVYFKAHKAVLAAFSNYFKMLFIHQTSDCVKLKPADIQPDIFSYLLHLMYTGKIIPQMIDPVRLEQGLKFLHAYPLLQEASLATHGAIPRPDPYFPWPSSLYGIQLARSQACVTVQEQKVHMMAAGLSSHSGPPPQSQSQQQQQPPLQSQPQSQSQPPPRSEQEQNVIEGPIPMSVSVTQAQTHLALQLPLQSTLQQPSQSAQPSLQHFHAAMCVTSADGALACAAAYGSICTCTLAFPIHSLLWVAGVGAEAGAEEACVDFSRKLTLETVLQVRARETAMEQMEPCSRAIDEWVAHAGSPATCADAASRRKATARSTCTSTRGSLDGPSTQLCSVCGDFSSGYHYGVWTCEGCKAFFKRSVQGKNNFVCPATNHCTIDKTRRRRCQACRLRKCYEAGMIRDGENDRISLTGLLLPEAQQHARDRLRVGGGDARRGGVRSFGGAVPHAHVEGMGIIHILLETEPPKLLCMRSLGEPLTEASMMTLFTDLATKEMVHIVSWAKKIPGFMELDLPVKTQLLENSWLEVLITGLIWRSMEQQDTLVFASDLVFTRADGSRMEGTMEIFDQLLAIVTHFRELCFRMEEYACLKAMVLLNVGLCSDWMLTEQPDAIKAVCKIMDTVSNALVSFLEHSCLSEGQQFHRLTRLLMLLSHIHQISYRASNKGIQHLTIMKMKHMIPLSTLLTNMLEGAQVK
ncbi:unnamed protein product [Lampetra planeri]